MTPALNSDGTYDYGTSWSAKVVAWAGFRAGSITGATSGTIYSNMTVNASSAAITDDLVTVLRYKGSYGFAGSVGGQGNTGAAYPAAQRLLDGYPGNSANWVKCINHQTLGNGQSYGVTRYQAFIVKTAVEDPSINLNVQFVTTDGGNGTVEGIVTHKSNWLKHVRITSHGGDKGHYGEGQLRITVSVPGMNSWSFVNTFWTNTD